MLEPRRSAAVWGNGSLRYLFENCVLDTDRRELRRGVEAVAVPPQVFDLLEYLIRNREHGANASASARAKRKQDK